MWLLAPLILLTYSLPWLSANSASLTFGAYDLAEWTSLHPLVRAQQPALLLPFLLRLPLACLALTMAFAADSKTRVLCALWVGLTAVSLLPPFAFFAGASGDPNYQQQAAFSLITGVSGLIILTTASRLKHWRVGFAVGTSLAGAAAALVGWLQGFDLMNGFQISADLAAGGILTCALFGCLTFTAIAVIKANGAALAAPSPDLHPVA
jgi:hypothetical protein